MTRRTKKIILLSSAIVLGLAIYSGYSVLKSNSGLIRQFLPFAVTVSNQTSDDIIVIEAGIVNGDSKQQFEQTIRNGEKIIFKPKLSLAGEGGIYIKYKNAGGETKEQGVCSYTESLSGYSKVTIKPDKVTVEENCM
ncbi:hypothetical protein [Paenibacillus harenae]|uniref:hypothetical protein n=1 Tax=Paenibacillus harenae TaxID=306543 RepID=UPI00278D4C01|nr:hypothetical protein [Paenibacillus harenae]MDQ0060346.1 hypothetical protein [Paenibacillus harenae]